MLHTLDLTEETHVLNPCHILPKDVELVDNAHNVSNLIHLLGELEATYLGISRGRSQHSCEDAQHGRFTCSIVSKNRKKLAILDFEINIL